MNGYPVSEIELIDPYACWRVVSGSVDVLLSPTDGQGPRHPVVRVESGQLMHGFAATDLPRGYTVMAVPAEGTSVRRVRRDAGALTAWARGLHGPGGRNGGRSVPPPGEGEPRALGYSDLRALHRGALAQVLLLAEAEQADRDNWRAARVAATGETLRRSFADVAVAAGAAHSPERPRTAAEHAMEVVKTLGDHCGFATRDIAPRSGEHQSADPLGAALDAARVRHRRVRLEERWWRKATVPMIGFTRDGGRPVALLPHRGGYLIADGGTRRVNETAAAALAPDAWQVYPPLDEGITSPLGLLKYGLRGAGKDLAWLLAAGGGAALLALGVPMFTFTLLKTAANPADRPAMIGIAVLIAGVVCAGAMLLAVRNAVLVRVQGRLQERLEPAVWSHLIALDLPFFAQYSTGELVQRANAVSDMRKSLGEAAVNSLLGGVFSLLGLLGLLVVDWRLAVAVLAGVAALLAVLAARAVRQQRHELVMHEQYGKVYSLLYSCLSAIDKIHVAGREAQVFELWTRLFVTQQRAAAAAQRERAVTSAIGAAAQPTLLLVLAVSALGLHVSAASFVIAAVALGQFVLALGQVNRAVEAAFALLPGFERLRPVLERPAETPPEAKDPGELTGLVRLSGVSFAYPGTTQRILDDVSMVFRPGEFVAVAGPSGAGKSTLVRLLLGFEPPRTGQVLYDGGDLRDLDLRRVRTQVGVVMQQARVLRGSILENIIGDVPGATEEDAWRAARLADLDGDIAAMPMGMHTIVSEDNASFSGGQLQRLLIARALVKRPRILVLDEATSALDNVTQALVSQRIAELDITRIVIAHRLSTIRSADRIYVLDQGRVVADGPFEELVERNPLFARMVRRQEV
ncbi:ATP-binding cassette domain-containing protein [Sphaerimonospora thailandensis]|uniref:NHLP family bacteriocin export ABC transporter permease/ATPase subunit n=1 Tax=Sphaerimonospora thailandensis TaxID=795644 RepID=A0A8J3RDZ3_9ACTN|nr:ATP-binding cassette domain-containing protein [Sphaerimonospora thailandensis]GIH72516.1 NHLP family bacteriocin export ABC transporter permease/ATPase subunit [Sphaerimonospora thailandensis]